MHRRGRRALAHVARGRRAGRRGASSRAGRTRDAQRRPGPTGFSSVPPPGPGDARSPRRRCPRRGARARPRRAPARPPRRRRRGARSAPPARRPARPSPRSEYDHDPAAHVRPRRPASPSGAPRAARPCTTPRVATVRPAGAIRPPRSSAATCSSTVLPSSENSVSGVARRARAPRTPRRPPRASRLVARHDLDLAAPQAGRDLQPLERHALALGRAQRLGDLRLGDPEQAQHPPPVRRRARERRAQRRGLHRRRPHRLQLARRARQHHDGRARSRPARAARPAPARSRPARGSSRPAGPPPACGCSPGSPPCRGPASVWRSGRRISAMRSSSASSSTISRPWNSPTTSAVRSSAVGPRPPLVTTRSSPWAAMKRSAASMSSRRSPTIVDVAPGRPRAPPADPRATGPLRSVRDRSAPRCP